MISNLIIENIQSHRKTEFEFHPGINTVKGPTDAGKSAAFRSLESVVCNRQPPDERWRRHDTKKSTITIGDVQKIRTATINEYRLNGQVFKALRTDVPQEISDALRLSDINFQGQHSAYFLINDSPGQVARTLNEVADLQVISSSLKLIRKKKSDTKTLRESKEADLKAQTAKVEALQWVLEADVDYQGIEKLQKMADDIDLRPLQEKVDLIKELQQLVENIPDPVDDLKRVAQAAVDIDVDLSLGDLLQRIEDYQVTIPDPAEDLDRLCQMSVDIDIDVDIGELRELITAAVDAKVTVQQFPAEVDDLTGVLDVMQMYDREINVLNSYLEDVDRAHTAVEVNDQAYQFAKNGYEEKLKEIGACPLCGGEIHENCLSG